jgi:hypothetical protein
MVVVPPAAPPAASGRTGEGPAGDIRAMLGVYGPVAAMVVVGAWLLRH